MLFMHEVRCIESLGEGSRSAESIPQLALAGLMCKLGLNYGRNVAQGLATSNRILANCLNEAGAAHMHVKVKPLLQDCVLGIPLHTPGSIHKGYNVAVPAHIAANLYMERVAVD